MFRIAAFFISLVFAAPLAAQQIAFGTPDKDRDAPVEVTSDRLAVSQNDNSAVFTGNVIVGQNDMRLAAPRVTVIYLENEDKIEILQARDGVTMTDGPDAAEAQEADYNIETGIVELRGNVLLLQGNDVITSDYAYIDTEAGTAQITGRVKTVIQPAGE